MLSVGNKYSEIKFNPNYGVWDEKIYDFVLKQISFDYKCHLELEDDYQKLSIKNRELNHKIDLLNEYDYKPSCLDDELVLEDLEGDLSWEISENIKEDYILLKD